MQTSTPFRPENEENYTKDQDSYQKAQQELKSLSETYLKSI